MAFDAHIEDFQRLGLHYAETLDAADPFGAVRSIGEFGRTFSQNRDSLPQSDADRAFNLVAKATDLIDYQLPFVDEPQGQKLIDDARKLLEEAVALDADCHDARRMLAAADSPSFEQYYRFLVDGTEEVRASCERTTAELDLPATPVAAYMRQLYMRPYHRWLASLASRALECGHYRKAVEAATKLLALDELDQADVRYTLALAYAKLEDEAALAELMAQDGDTEMPDNPWFALARLALAYKRLDFAAAKREVKGLLNVYPRARMILSQQSWLPNGVFSRVAFRPESDDALLLAVSEATVLLQEGVDASERGALGSWVSHLPSIAGPDGAAEAMALLDLDDTDTPTGDDGEERA